MTNSYCLQTIDRIFVYKRPDVFFNQPDDFLKHQGVCEKHRDRLYKSPKGALPNAQGSDG